MSREKLRQLAEEQLEKRQQEALKLEQQSQEEE
jgi:hypothetical protein